MASSQAKMKEAAERRRKERLDAMYAGGTGTAGSPFASTVNVSPTMSLGLFSLENELKKVFKLTEHDLPWPTSTNDQDWTDLQPEFTLGFGVFMAVLEIMDEVKADGGTQTCVKYDLSADPATIMTVYKKFKQTRVTHNGKHWMVLSTFCSPDIAWERFQEVKHTFLSKAIAYSQPSYLHILGENC